MSNATITDLGKVNNAGTADALFLKVWAGEVLTSFEQYTCCLLYTSPSPRDRG